MASQARGSHAKILARACQLCRNRKIRCDNARPRCGTCVNHDKECIYRLEAPRKRPTLAQIQELQQDKSTLISFISCLRISSPEEREALLSHPIKAIRHGEQDNNDNPSKEAGVSPTPPDTATTLVEIYSEDEDIDIASFISIDEIGNPVNFGPSSALHNPRQSQRMSPTGQKQIDKAQKNNLIANAALIRQSEYHLTLCPDIAGVPTDIALHLLNVHWERQHHTFLLTYRPAVMRDLLENGPQCSVFLLHAIFACSKKFSKLEGCPDNEFYIRCEKLLMESSLILKPTIPTLVGLLLLGSTSIARGETSKGWLYTGYALRMVYDLGLNLDPQETINDPEEIEIRRRVFWGAFICDKLQSLYLGRPIAINLRDYHVSRELLDTFEEKELFNSSAPRPTPLYSVSTFQQFCLLSKVMTLIINRFYVVGASLCNARSNLQTIEAALEQWRQNLPRELDFVPSEDIATQYPAPNIMTLHGIYHSLVILLHRPFISDGHLRPAVTCHHSWEKCTSAAQIISYIARSYDAAYGLSRAPYILSYAIYVACTIHVRNAAGETASNVEHKSLLRESLNYLSYMRVTNPGVNRALGIIRHLIAANKIDLDIERTPTVTSVEPVDLELIFSTFPSTTNAGVSNPNSNETPDTHGHLDPLFGLMEMPAMEFDDVLPERFQVNNAIL